MTWGSTVGAQLYCNRAPERPHNHIASRLRRHSFDKKCRGSDSSTRILINNRESPCGGAVCLSWTLVNRSVTAAELRFRIKWSHNCKKVQFGESGGRVWYKRSSGHREIVRNAGPTRQDEYRRLRTAAHDECGHKYDGGGDCGCPGTLCNVPAGLGQGKDAVHGCWADDMLVFQSISGCGVMKTNQSATAVARSIYRNLRCSE